MDCIICYFKKPSLKTLSCKHSLCSNCYLRLANTVCPFCREAFVYTADEIKQKTKIGLKYKYPCNDVQPGLALPDEFVLNVQNQLVSNSIFHRNQIIENQYLIIEDGYNSTRSKKKNKKYSKGNQNTGLSIEEINEQRQNISKREFKKWSRKDGRLYKINSCLFLEIDN